MGFDLFIEVSFMMCPVTGKPYYFTSDLKKEFDISSVSVPEHLRYYLEQRGKYLHEYTSYFNYNNEYEKSVYDFLEKFPDWKDICNSEYFGDYWTEDDHKKFKELLEFCKKSRASFRVTWSY